ncbi:hypothetical protein BAE30_08220 [Acidithiobacillus caldus]|uniref:Uncharacterized protein n=1 Tax=Acidithiobacillus caldus TaxID=33059 RepID=A0A1E7YVS0_9PROT|nr:hypothetical protein BAE30_08220 [Acidithiobacillus caldus]
MQAKAPLDRILLSVLCLGTERWLYLLMTYSGSRLLGRRKKQEPIITSQQADGKRLRILRNGLVFRINTLRYVQITRTIHA